eukprot:548906_1
MATTSEDQPFSFESGHTDLIHDVQIDFYGKTLASASSDRVIRIFEIIKNEHKLLTKLTGHRGPVWKLSWAHPKYGRVLASCGYDKQVIIWRQQNGSKWIQWFADQFSSSVNTVQFSPSTNNNRLELIAGSSDGSIRVYALQNNKPMTSRDLVGNTKCIQQLRDFLNSWDRIKKDKDCKKRGVLLSGQPGIGKTSAIHVVAKELGFSVLEFNASDTRSKKSLRNVVQESLNNGRISDFFGVKNGAKMKKKKAKNLIIMDEVDGMSSGDRGGIKELMGYIDKSMIPMICICNDRNSQKVRSLAGHCLDLRFRKPTPYQIKNRLFAIARAEGFECDVPTIQKLAEGTNGDIRQMLHLLQFWSNGNHNGRGKQKLSFNDVNAKLKSMNQKDLTMGPWDVVPKLFYAQTPLMKGIEYYFVDYSFIPLFIHENYLNLNLYKNRTNKFTVDELSSLCAATDSMSDGDIIDHNIRKSQQYAALPYHAILSTVKPGKYVSGIGNISGRIAFPQWLGKNSSRRKNDKLCSELALNMATSTDCVALDYLMMLKQECVAPLRKGREEDIDQVVQFMKSYNIRRVDWDTIYNLQTFDKGSKGKGKSTGDIATRVKTKFTKRCNAELGAANKTIKNKKNAKRMDVNDLKVKKEDDDEYVEDEDDDDDDISKDSSIKIKAGSKSKKK